MKHNNSPKTENQSSSFTPMLIVSLLLILNFVLKSSYLKNGKWLLKFWLLCLLNTLCISCIFFKVISNKRECTPGVLGVGGLVGWWFGVVFLIIVILVFLISCR